MPAADERHRRHTIADAQARDTLAQRDDFAREFMADDRARRDRGAGFRRHVQVAAANAGAPDLDQHFAGTRTRIGSLLDGKRLANALEYRCLHVCLARE